MAVVINIPLGLAGLATSRWFSELYARRELVKLNRIAQTASAVASIPSSLVALLLIMFPVEIGDLIYGTRFESISTPIRLLSIAQLVFVYTGLAGLLLIQSGHAKSVLMVNALAALTMIVAGGLVAGTGSVIAFTVVTSVIVVGKNTAVWMLARKIIKVSTHPNLSLLHSFLRHQISRFQRSRASLTEDEQA